MKDVIQRLSLNEDDVLALLNNEGYTNFNDIFIALLRVDGTLFLIPRKRM